MKKIFFVITASLAMTTICHAQANTKLSNLVAPTAVNASLIPGGGTGTKDLGSNNKRWRNGYFNASVYAYGVGSSYGVYGANSAGYGVYGTSGYIGVYGTGTSYGVYGYSSSGYGVSGSSGYLGVYGSGTTYGLYGYSSAGYGVSGISGSSYAVYGSGYIGTIGYGTYVGAWGEGDSYGLVGYGGPYGVWATGTSYAGYFSGNVYASGVYSGSDKALKKNIKEFSSAMDIINKLKPRQYEFRNDANYAKMNLPAGSHYGLIAQDVEEVLPNLVKGSEFNTSMRRPVPLKSDQDGNPVKTADNVAAPKSETINFKAVNYTELIPIMIKAMQELSKQNDDLKTQVATLTQTVSQLSKSNGIISASSASINQNFPNPFTKSTVISFNVPQGSSANIIVSQTGSGKVVKTITLSAGTSQLTFDGASLAAGSYSYSLYIDGKKIDTKQMIINR